MVGSNEALVTRGDVIRDFIQRVADGQFRGNLGDGKSGRLRRQSRTARHARIHLDDDHVAVLGIDPELNVRSAGVDPNLADDAHRRITHDLVFLVRQRHGRRNGNTVAGVNTHGIEIFDGTDDDDIVFEVPHDLQFEFLPADDRAFHQDFVDGTHG